MDKIRKIKSKKVLLALVLLIVIATTFAYFTTTDTFENIFRASKYGTTSTEVFTSPNDWKPGDTTEKKVTVTNTGNVCENVRVSYTEKWVSENGNNLPLKDSTLNENIALINFDNTDEWTLHNGYYYYYKDLLEGDTTSSFIKSVTFNPKYTGNVSCTTTIQGNERIDDCTSGKDSYEGGTYTLTIKVETVQCSAITDVWNEGTALVAIDSAANISTNNISYIELLNPNNLNTIQTITGIESFNINNNSGVNYNKNDNIVANKLSTNNNASKLYGTNPVDRVGFITAVSMPNDISYKTKDIILKIHYLDSRIEYYYAANVSTDSGELSANDISSMGQQFGQLGISNSIIEKLPTVKAMYVYAIGRKMTDEEIEQLVNINTSAHKFGVIMQFPDEVILPITLQINNTIEKTLGLNNMVILEAPIQSTNTSLVKPMAQTIPYYLTFIDLSDLEINKIDTLTIKGSTIDEEREENDIKASFGHLVKGESTYNIVIVPDFPKEYLQEGFNSMTSLDRFKGFKQYSVIMISSIH